MNEHTRKLKQLPKKAQIFVKKIRAQADRTINQNHLIKQGDIIVAGLSGGKDSLSMLEILWERLAHIPAHYHIYALYVDIVNIPYHADTAQIKEFCQKRGIPFHYERQTIPIDTNKNNICFICSWHRRRILFEYARKLNAGKVALGHHKDDTLETLLMNMFFNGSVSALPASLEMFGGRIELIRPLLEITEAELKEYAHILDIEPAEKTCPHAHQTKRELMKQMLSWIEEHDPRTKRSLFRAMSNIYPDYLARDSM